MDNNAVRATTDDGWSVTLALVESGYGGDESVSVWVEAPDGLRFHTHAYPEDVEVSRESAIRQLGLARLLMSHV